MTFFHLNFIDIIHGILTSLGFSYTSSAGFIWMGMTAVNFPVIIAVLLFSTTSIIMGAWLCKSIQAYYGHDGDMSNLFSAIIAVAYLVFAVNNAGILIAFRSYQSLNILIGISKLVIAYFFTMGILGISTYYTSMRTRHLCQILTIVCLLFSIAGVFSSLYVWGGALINETALSASSNYLTMLVFPLVMNIKDFTPNIFLLLGEMTIYAIGFIYAIFGKLDMRYRVSSLLLIISSMLLSYCAIRYSLFTIYSESWNLGSAYFAIDTVKKTVGYFFGVPEFFAYVFGHATLFFTLFYNSIFNAKSKMSVDYIEYELKRQQRSAEKRGETVVTLKVRRDNI